MSRTLPLILLAILAAAGAEDKPIAPNLDFEAGAGGGGHPKDWGGGGAGYKLEADEAIKHGGKVSGRIRFVESAPDSVFATLTQCLKPEALRGKRVRYSGWMKSEKVEGDTSWAGLWMRVDGKDDKVLSFDNMQDRGVKGTTDWKKYEVVLDVPTDATGFCFGFLLAGKGTLWGDDLSFEVVDKDKVKTTGAPLAL